MSIWQERQEMNGEIFSIMHSHFLTSPTNTKRVTKYSSIFYTFLARSTVVFIRTSSGLTREMFAYALILIQALRRDFSLLSRVRLRAHAKEMVTQVYANKDARIVKTLKSRDAKSERRGKTRTIIGENG